MLPKNIAQLIEELKSEIEPLDVDVTSQSKAIINDDTSDIDIEISGKDCLYLFASDDTIERLFDLIDNPDDTYLTLVELNFDSSVVDMLERHFAAVDEAS
jgi:hypothetical protein